jgi:putative transposase
MHSPAPTFALRDAAMCDVAKARASAEAALKAGSIEKFTLGFRSKKDRQQSFVVPNRGYKRSGDGFSCFRRFMRDTAGIDPVIKAREPLPETIAYDARLVLTRLGEWYLCIPVVVDMPHALGDESQVPSRLSRRVCSLDPGVRTFQTLYDADGALVEVGAGDLARLYRLCKAADDLQSRRAAVHGKRRYRMQRAYLRIFERIRRLVHEVHCKLVCFLVRNYAVVLLPSFDTSRMVVRGQRKLRSKTVRAMLTWSHYGFKQRLLNKAYASGGQCQVVICDEAYTSKTCTRCGVVHQKLGGAKVFRCPKCALVIDRDHNGARNILLKNASHFQLNASAARL